MHSSFSFLDDEKCILVLTSLDHLEKLDKEDYSKREYCKKMRDDNGIDYAIITDTYLSNGLESAVRTSMMAIEGGNGTWFLGIAMDWTKNMVTKHKDKFGIPDIDVAFVDHKKIIHNIIPIRNGNLDPDSLSDYDRKLIDNKLDETIHFDEFVQHCGPDFGPENNGMIYFGKFWIPHYDHDQPFPKPPTKDLEQIPLKMIACFPHHDMSSIVIEIFMILTELIILFASGHHKSIKRLMKI